MGIRRFFAVVAIGGACLIAAARCGTDGSPSPGDALRDGGFLDSGVPVPPPPTPGPPMPPR